MVVVNVEGGEGDLPHVDVTLEYVEDLQLVNIGQELLVLRQRGQQPQDVDLAHLINQLITQIRIVRFCCQKPHVYAAPNFLFLFSEFLNSR